MYEKLNSLLTMIIEKEDCYVLCLLENTYDWITEKCQDSIYRLYKDVYLCKPQKPTNHNRHQ